MPFTLDIDLLVTFPHEGILIQWKLCNPTSRGIGVFGWIREVAWLERFYQKSIIWRIWYKSILQAIYHIVHNITTQYKQEWEILYVSEKNIQCGLSQCGSYFPLSYSDLRLLTGVKKSGSIHTAKPLMSLSSSMLKISRCVKWLPGISSSQSSSSSSAISWILKFVHLIQ